MSEDFTKGYTRDVHGTAKVLSALAKAMDEHPNLRLGQLLFEVIALHDFKTLDAGSDHTLAKEKKEHYNEHFHGRLFYIYDEEITKALEEF